MHESAYCAILMYPPAASMHLLSSGSVSHQMRCAVGPEAQHRATFRIRCSGGGAVFGMLGIWWRSDAKAHRALFRPRSIKWQAGKDLISGSAWRTVESCVVSCVTAFGRFTG